MTPDAAAEWAALLEMLETVAPDVSAKVRDHVSVLYERIETALSEREEWSAAIRTVAYGHIPSPHAARSAIEELKTRWEKARDERAALRTQLDALARAVGAAVTYATLAPGDDPDGRLPDHAIVSAVRTLKHERDVAVTAWRTAHHMRTKGCHHRCPFLKGKDEWCGHPKAPRGDKRYILPSDDAPDWCPRRAGPTIVPPIPPTRLAIKPARAGKKGSP